MRHTVTTRSGEIAYTSAGTETGRTALFVHGVGVNGGLWRNVIAELDGHSIALDLPLHGGSPPREDYSLPALAEAIEDFCAALDLHDIDLVANDTGGAVAQVFAARHPERLRTFALTNCDTHDNLPPEEFKPTLAAAQRGDISARASTLVKPAAARATIFANTYEHPELVSDETITGYLEPVLGTPERARHFERFLISVTAEDLLAAEPALRELAVPTLVVWGTADDFFALDWAYWLRDTIPGVTKVIEIEGGKLFFPEEHGGELAALLRDHWAAN
ncbi:alpha/beta hydrolase [Solihabitans fulvus]|uniref:Alpha/beta hydrolase n=1 Tax=Solihabitans fulvus TaxID=1892852 RepID=A0A5B2XD92_9PSEU|nr:alpha/beta hydrolase [Solihabitans fulvus]KAA2261166.1 alpha/beta hydrolase [Solihabitans fulvus]